ncbi:MAG: radical SAM protein [Planctomycetes bacterium]|nr:radical SAM protein [Planctomycetota bacterium]
MKVALVNASRQRGCTLKDVAGGFGTVFTVGRSLPARLLELAKQRVAALPNVTLAYLDAILSENGAEVLFLDARGPDDLAAADLYLIASSIVDCSLERELGLAARRRFGARVGYFGAFAAARPEYYEDAADFIVRQDVENLAPELARGRVPRGVVDAGFVPDLEALPFPRWERFDLRRSRYRIITRRGPTLPVLASRGCAYLCDYCPYLVNARYRTRSATSIAREIEHLCDRYGARGISFRDPLRVFSAAEARRFAELLEERGLDVRFSMECRADLLDEETLRELHRAGLRCVEIGVETADPAVVRARGRRAPDLRQQERVIELCHRRGIRVIANYMLGLPNDTQAGMRATIRYAKRLNTVAVQFTVATPYPGTTFHDEVRERIFERDFERFNGWTNVFRHERLTPEEIHRLREWAYVSYHFRPRYAWRLLTTLLRR